ncbi:AMP-binding protein [Longispora sp. K20-0274]|uniref:AMP-binding protein n=1 Tax=Longispora sp. K20-0274 TaxID=3088255 RepID=UPI00399A7AC5
MDLSPTAHVDTFARDHLPPVDQWPELLLLDYPDRLNCAVELLDWAPDLSRPCLITPAETWTYADLLARANQIANVLVDDFGLVPGNRVLLRAPNNAWLVACWFAVLKAGGIAVTTMALLRDHELEVISEIAEVNLSLVDDRFPCALDNQVLFGDLIAAATKKPEQFANVATAADDVALLAFTSGTTGRPKATMHFHRDVLAIADTFSAQVLRPDADDVFAGSPPLGFTFGLGALVVFPMRAGASTVLLEKGTPDVLLPAVVEHKVTILCTAPTAYRVMLGQLPELPYLKKCVSAGEPLPKATWEAWHEATGIKLIDGIGATELLHIFISAAGDDIRPGSTGRPVPGFLATVLDDDGNEVGPDVVGRLAVKGPTGCRYLADDRQTVYVQNGWNLTGDTYLRDEDGYFWYQARSDDMIISAGINIAPPEVEWALLSHPDVLECAVVGLPDEERTMVVAAYVVLAPGVVGDEAKADELREHCRREIAPYKMPRVVEFLAALPRTSTGKVQRYRLRAS